MMVNFELTRAQTTFSGKSRELKDSKVLNFNSVGAFISNTLDIASLRLSFRFSCGADFELVNNLSLITLNPHRFRLKILKFNQRTPDVQLREHFTGGFELVGKVIYRFSVNENN